MTKCVLVAGRPLMDSARCIRCRSDPSRSRRHIVVLLNPVISKTSGSLTTRPPLGGGIKRRRLGLGFPLRVWILIRTPPSPTRRRRSSADPQPVVPHPMGSSGRMVVIEHTQGDPQPGRGSTPRGRAQPRPVAHPPPSGRASSRVSPRPGLYQRPNRGRGPSQQPRGSAAMRPAAGPCRCRDICSRRTLPKGDTRPRRADSGEHRRHRPRRSCQQAVNRPG